MVPDPRDEGKETVFTISGGGDGGVKDQDQDQDQDVASVTKTDKSIGGGHVISKNSFHCKIQYSLNCQAQPLLISTTKNSIKLVKGPPYTFSYLLLQGVPK